MLMCGAMAYTIEEVFAKRRECVIECGAYIGECVPDLSQPCQYYLNDPGDKNLDCVNDCMISAGYPIIAM